MRFLRTLFIWWRDATAGTWLTTWLTGIAVGRDAFGNRYFRNKSDTRRWVVYRGTVDASRVPSAWHGWLHRLCDLPPADSRGLGYQPNLSGTEGAYCPPGSLRRCPAGAVNRSYEPWRPE